MSDGSLLNWLLFLVGFASLLLLLLAYNQRRHIQWHIQRGDLS